MRSTFPGYYQPTQENLISCGRKGFFLLMLMYFSNIYRYSHSTRERFFEILDKLKDRIWVPYQAVFEYQENRLDVISEQIDAYENIVKDLDASIEEDPVIGDIHICNSIRSQSIMLKADDKVKKIIANTKKEHPDLLTSDDLRQTITTLFDGKVGQPYAKRGIN